MSVRLLQAPHMGPIRTRVSRGRQISRMVEMETVSRDRFDLSLELLKPSDWKLFEDLSSDFLAPEFPALRTVATASGDEGRDATLFAIDDADATAFQYSVAEDWVTKIRRTLKRLEETRPGRTRVLVYLTNRVVGAKADDLRKELAGKSIHLDVRDRTWFLERVNSAPGRQAAADRVIEAILTPYLASRRVIETKAQALNDVELRTAAVYLGMQWEDDTREKGLTKLSFDAVVRGVLRDTTPDARMSREQVHARVRGILPTHPPELVDQHTDSALQRLAKRRIRHYEKFDEFCLTHEDRQAVAQHLADLELNDRAFQQEVLGIVESRTALLDAGKVPPAADVAARIRRILDRLLLTRGERFANAVRTGEMRLIGLDDLERDFIQTDIANSPPAEGAERLTPLLTESIRQILVEGGPASRAYLRRVADSYTLLAFLREMPDVQSALVKMFAEGDIWLDTSMVLPLLAETLLGSKQRRFSHMLSAAVDSGLKLRITDGVLEEIERHINRALACARQHDRWQGRTPFLLSVFMATGRSIAEFPKWVEQFAGASRPEDDIADYIREEHSIIVGSLEKAAESTEPSLKTAVQEAWHVVHDRRRGAGPSDMDNITRERLVRHDVENYLGVIETRKNERTSALGYNTWWLTLDSEAFDLREELRSRLQGRVPDSPVMSPDFLVNYLAFGPVRRLVKKGVEAQLPVAIDIGIGDLPKELMDVAEQVRGQLHDKPERLIRREVRDQLDRARMRRGAVSVSGPRGMQREIEDAAKAERPGRPT